MIAPVILKILFWPALLASIYYSIRLIIDGYTVGWIPLIVGSLFVRIVFEGMLLFFSVNDMLFEISRTLENKSNE